MPASRQPLARLVAVEAVIATALLALAPMLDVGVLFAGRGWWVQAGTADLTSVLIWWTAIAIAAWTALTTMTCVASRTVPRLRAMRALDAFTLPLVRRAVDQALAWTLAGTLVGAAIAAPAYARSAPTSAATTTTPPAVVRVTPDGEVVVAPERDHPSTTTPTPPSPAPPTTSPPPTATAVHVVVAGDNLWRIASARLAGERGFVPSDADVAPYWSRVIDANRATLRSGDPNLIFPGELVDLPPA